MITTQGLSKTYGGKVNALQQLAQNFLSGGYERRKGGASED